MSALLDSPARNSFSAHLALPDGVTATIHAPDMHALRNVVARLQPTEAANEGNAPTPAAATVPAGSPVTPTAAPSAPPAAAAAVGDVGNAGAGAPQGASSAPAASSTKPAESPVVDFDTLKKAFLALSTKPAGREKCEAVLKPFGLAKLSAATPEQYAAVLAEIQKASA